MAIGIAGIGFGQAVDDCEAVAVGRQRADEVALGDLRIADPTVRDIEIAIGAISSGRVARGEKGLGGPGQRTSCHPEIAELNP